MKLQWRHILTWSLAVCAAVGVSVLTIMAQSVPQPVLSITALGTNQFLIGITNGVTNATYELHWRPALNNTNYPWQVVGTNDLGQTNFLVEGGLWESGYFMVTIGIDLDGDGVADWEDASPNNSAIGVLSVTIDSPLNGTVLQ